MPDLPTFKNVPQAKYDRVISAWGDEAAFLAWLRGVIRSYVVAEETRREVEPYESTARAIRAAKAADDPLAGAS